MKMEIHIAKIKINITLRVVKSIVGFVELEYLDFENGVVFVVRGYTIKVKSFGDNEPIFTVDAPAYGSGFKLRKSFIVEDKGLYFKLEKEILKEFVKLAGGKTPKDYLLELEEIKIPNNFQW
jgi:hypothetical protein